VSAANSVPCLYAAFEVSCKVSVDFLVDTGASISLFPLRLSKALSVTPSAVKLSSVEGNSVAVHGECRLSIANKALRRRFQWQFVIADVPNAIRGVDFLTTNRISVSCSQRCLTDEITGLRIKCKTCPFATTAPVLAMPSTNPEVSALLTAHSSLFQPIQFDGESKSSVGHVIDTGNAQPVFSRPRQLSPQLLSVAKEEFRKLLDLGIVRPSSSPWASPLHLVKKADNSWRPCGDYRALNNKTVPDRYPVPHVHHLFQRAHGCQVFSKIDLVKAYHQIPVAEADIPKTAVTTPFGLFEYVRMPFGLRNASQTFQRHMDSIFRDDPNVCVYIDDILVASKTMKEHLTHLRSVLQNLQKHNLKISAGKSVFAVPAVNFLGCTVSSSGVQPDSARCEAIHSFPSPGSFADLRRFLGMVGYYRRFLPHFADVVLPMQSLVTRYMKTPKEFKWSEDAEEAFNNTKKALTEAASLHPIDDSSPIFQLVTDASLFAVGAALHQKSGDHFRPIAFFSKKLIEPQKAYSAYDRELLAVYLSLLHFRSIIEGQQTTVVTDHKPLVTAFNSSAPSKSDRQQRYFNIIKEHISDMLYIRGSDNVVADSLSRAVNSVQIDTFDLANIVNRQKGDTELESFKERLKSYSIPSGTIWCDVSTFFPRPFLPVSVRRCAFDQLHSLSHPGISSSTKLISARYMWPNMNRDIKQWCRECSQCQQAKIGRHTKGALQSFNMPATNRFEVVHMDIVGPLPPSLSISGKPSSCKYLVTFIDRATRWVEVEPISNIGAEEMQKHSYRNGCRVLAFLSI